MRVGDKEIVLVGTAHVSQQSVEDVQRAIEEEKPDVVGVELDKERLNQLVSGARWGERNVVELIQQGQTHLLLLNLLLLNMQRRIGSELGVRPGAELMQAIALAREKNIPIQLLDRDVRVTFQRAMSNTPLLEKLSLFFSFVFGLFQSPKRLSVEEVERLKQQDVLNMVLKELAQKAPGLKRVLVDERDALIAHNILSAPGKKIVAVVGAGHLEGIQQYLKQPIAVRSFYALPKKSAVWNSLQYIVPLLFVAIVGYGFFVRGFSGTIELFGYWFLITGILSAIGALLARAKPLSILTAFVAAPFTTLHPALASGWFAAAMESRFVQPQVKDFESLNELNSWNDFQKNKVTHLLVVAALTNLGSTIGVVVALPVLFKLVGL